MSQTEKMAAIVISIFTTYHATFTEATSNAANCCVVTSTRRVQTLVMLGFYAGNQLEEELLDVEHQIDGGWGRRRLPDRRLVFERQVSDQRSELPQPGLRDPLHLQHV